MPARTWPAIQRRRLLDSRASARFNATTVKQVGEVMCVVLTRDHSNG